MNKYSYTFFVLNANHYSKQECQQKKRERNPWSGQSTSQSRTFTFKYIIVYIILIVTFVLLKIIQTAVRTKIVIKEDILITKDKFIKIIYY